MEYANQLSGVVGTTVAVLGLLLAFFAAPVQARANFLMTTVLLSQIAIILTAIWLIFEFSKGPEPATRKEIVNLLVWVFNLVMGTRNVISITQLFIKKAGTKRLA
jgi:hypothetical protein